MTQLTGCRPSNKEIVDKFDDFITMFPTEDLTVLYDKEGDTSGLPSGDLGTWVVSSYLYTKDEESKNVVGITLSFNRNTREATGYLIVKETIDGIEVANEYQIYYDREGIYLVDENIEDSVREELYNFNMMYEFISLSRQYLDNLDAKEFYYNGEVPMYYVTYNLTSDDVNIDKIREMYPELSIDENNLSLYLEGDDATDRLSLEIYLDGNYDNYFSSAMTLNKSN